jgi:type IV secretion system protein VirB4
VSEGFLYTLLPWNFITKFHEGVVVQKDGLLQRSFAYRAPDLDSAGEFEVNALCLRVNDFAKRLGAGWAFFVEAQRFYTQDYPKKEPGRADGFDSLAGYLIDREREASFSAAGRHFESSYYLTFAWKPPTEGVKKLTSLFIQSSSDDKEGKTIKENVQYFVNETNAIVGILASNMLIEPLSNEETLSYLHSTVSMNRHEIRYPHNAILLDRLLPDTPLTNSMPMQLGGYFIPIIGVNDFPEETYPDILDSLNRARLEYRWVSRYVCLGKEAAKKEAGKKEKAHRGSKKSFLQTFAEATSNDGSAGSGVTNHGAGVKEADSQLAGMEIDTDAAALGYLTSCVMVWDKELPKARKKAETVRTIIQSAGFTCKEETFGANEAWRSMMPGQVYANFRSLPVMSYNLSHFIPLSSVWSGQRINAHAGYITGVSLPHVTCSTLEGTPFYLNLNPKFSQSSGDVGHASIFGPTGAGKSTVIGILAAQFLKYPNSLVIAFDKGKSIRQI